MTLDGIRKLTAGSPRCPCGGRLRVSGPVGDLKKKKRGLVHLVIRCRKCRAWYGGFTFKEKMED